MGEDKKDSGSGGAEAEAEARELLPLVYEELRQIARRRMSGEAAGATLDATALVHEAYVKLVGSGGGEDGRQWKGRVHFLAAAAEAMRRILVDRARSRGAVKRGGGLKLSKLDVADLADEEVGEEVLALDEALGRLAQESAQAAEVVKLRFFGGLSMPEVAEVLGISVTTAERKWAYARAWLVDALGAEGGAEEKA